MDVAQVARRVGAQCVGSPPGAHYVRHRPEDTVLYGVVEEYHESFYQALGEQGTPLPAFVYAEFERYPRCGRLEHGFVQVKCTGCRHEHLVAFSCKGRGFCPSCGARRMLETAAGLVEHVFPHVPVRQWVDPNRSDRERISLSFNLMFSHYAERMAKPLWEGGVRRSDTQSESG